MPKRKPTDDEIREAAYHMWLDDGAPEGGDQAYWFRAEAALSAAKPKAAPRAKAAATKAPARKAPAKRAPKA
ncbi:DUF2934 domain-containing protein [Maritimibacter sp. HL-12]|uniref:DUF2934 domain-containing protein n=1 Tax=Maritimibacter sp. HL-12 TaxID=1162418 RepID=UPI000A0F1354|nr:DUF2934 domain-containing protein [Maritimibacter sp. HL-12]SMH53019.1 Protein of unknown function [Maritimibacter sp. HL-12]